MFQAAEVVKLKKSVWKMQVEMTEDVQQIKKKVQEDIMKTVFVLEKWREAMRRCCGVCSRVILWKSGRRNGRGIMWKISRRRNARYYGVQEDKYSDDYAEEEERKLCVADVM